MAGYRSRPEVSRYQSWDSYSIQQAKELIALMEHSSPEVKGEWYQFGVELAETGQLIGDVGVLNTDAEGKCWIGFTLDPAYWNRGLASEAVGAVLSFYTSIGISVIHASTDPLNAPSRKMLERLGFSLVELTEADAIYRLSSNSADRRASG
jgi:RimJ/RimL family protein N-acetyltransferase